MFGGRASMTWGLMISTSPHIYIHLQASRLLRMHPIGPIAARIISISVLELSRHWMQRVQQIQCRACKALKEEVEALRRLELQQTPACQITLNCQKLQLFLRIHQNTMDAIISDSHCAFIAHSQCIRCAFVVHLSVWAQGFGH
jgi:hypothetical protein